MSLTLEQVQVLIKAETGPYKKALSDIKNQTANTQKEVAQKVNGLNNTFSKIGSLIKIAAIGGALYKVGQYGTQMALEVSAAMNQIRRTMGESSQSFLKWANNGAIAYNIAKGDAIKYGAVYSNLFSNFIKDNEQLTGYTVKMLETSSIIASATGRTMDDVMNRIRSGMLGSTEAIEDLGINVNVAMLEATDAFRQFSNGRSWDQLDFNTQQAIRMMAILEQASKKYGNSLMQGPTTSLAYFIALLKNSALNIGNALLPVMSAIMPALTAFASFLNKATGALATFMQLLFGKTVNTSGGLSNTMNDIQDATSGIADNLGNAGDGAGKLGDGIGKAGDKAKKAAKDMLGLLKFDEINSLKKSDNNDDGGGSGGGGGGGGGKPGGSGGLNLPKVTFSDTFTEKDAGPIERFIERIMVAIKRLMELVELFKKGLVSAFHLEGLERIQEALKRIVNVIQEIFTDSNVVEAFNTMLNKWAYSLGQFVGSIGTIGIAIGVFIVESIATALENNKERIKTSLVKTVEAKGDLYRAAGNIAESISDTIYKVLTGKGAIRIGSAITGAFISIYQDVTEIGSKIGRDLMEAVEKIVKKNAPGIAKTINKAFEAIAPIFETAEKSIMDIGDTLKGVYDNSIKPLIEQWSDIISNLVSIIVSGFDKYVNPTLNKVGNAFSDVYNQYIQPAISSFGGALSSFANAISEIWTALEPLYNLLASALGPILGVVAGVLGGTILTALSLLAIALKTVFDFLGGFFDLIASVVGALSDFANTVVTVLPEGFQSAWEGITGIFRGMGQWFSERWNDVTTALTNVTTWFTTMFQNAWTSLTNIFKPLGQWFGQRWNDVATTLSNIASWFGNMFQSAWSKLTNVFSPLGSWFGQRWNNVTTALSGVASWFGNIFSNAYNAVKNAFSGIGAFFSDVWGTVQSIFVNAGQGIGSAVGGAFRYAVNAVLGTIENVVNGFIGMINGVIGLINKIPGVSLGSIGYVNLPRLAKGGIIDSATLAVVGEAGREAVMPLENNTGWITDLAGKVADRMPNNGGGNNNGTVVKEIVVQIGDKEFGRFAIDEINKAHEQAGRLLLNI